MAVEPSRRDSLLDRLAGIDTRSLALFRVSLALLVLVDLALRSRELVAFYTDAGVLPTWAAVQWLGAQSRFVVHTWSGATWYQALLFALTAVAALAMLVGYRTRWATAVTWFLVASLQARNPTLANGGDNLLRIMLFWAILVPLGARWSVDRARSARPAPTRALSVATFAIQLQLCLMYWFTAALKWHPTWFETFTATEIALSVDHLTTSLGRLLLDFPDLLRALTAFTVGLEIVGPILVWSPVATGPVRFLVVLTFVLFHLAGLAPTLYLGLFPWICAAAWLVFLPSWMWDRLERDRAAGFARVGGWCERLAGWLPGGRAGPGAALDPPTGGGRLGRRIESAVAAVLLVFVVVWNLATLERSSDTLLTPTLRAAVRVTGLGQRWAMFAPHPPLDDGWYVMPGRTEKGREVDVWRGGPVSWAKPADVAASYGHKRWNKYLDNLSRERYLYHRPLFGEYVCRRWNRAHAGQDRLLEFQMVLMLERYDTPHAAPQPTFLWAQRCEGNAPEPTSTPESRRESRARPSALLEGVDEHPVGLSDDPRRDVQGLRPERQRRRDGDVLPTLDMRLQPVDLEPPETGPREHRLDRSGIEEEVVVDVVEERQGARPATARQPVHDLPDPVYEAALVDRDVHYGAARG